MKKVCLILIIIFSISIFTAPAHACTSFAVYSKNVYYGMNFDYPDANFRLNIGRNGNIKSFYLDLEYEKDNYGKVCGMNSDGLFASNQIVYPDQANRFLPKDNVVNLPELTGIALKQYKNVKEIEELIKNKIFINVYVKYTFHDLFADKSGNAMVLEVGEKSNQITKMQNNIIVMTNFPNSSLSGKNYKEAAGAGADRYKTAYEYILSKKDDFTVNDGLEVLKKTIQGKESGWPTQCSMLFDPEKNEVYVVLKSDFSKVWKVSIDKEKVETFSGFKNFSKLEFDYDGITWQELTDPGKFSGFDWYMILLPIIGVSIIIIFLVSWFLGRRKRIKKFVW